MTIRNIIRDGRTNTKNIGMSGYSLVGEYFNKNQNGANSPNFPDVLTDNAYQCIVDRRIDPFITIHAASSPYVRRATMRTMSGTDGTSKPMTWSAASESILLGRIADQIRGHDFNLGTFLGEGHQTARMIGDSAIAIARSLRALRRGDLSGAAARLGLGKQAGKKLNPRKDAASNWLALQYGWMPLLSDVHSGAEALAFHMRRPHKVRYRARYTQKDDSDYVTAHPYTYRRRAGITKSYILELNEDAVPSIPQNLGLEDPEVIAWELVPFSFVLDWFVPIGDYLQLRAEVGRLNGKWITSTKSFCASQGWSIPGLYTQSEAERAYMRTTLRYLSTFNRSISYAPPRVPLPRFKPLQKVGSVKHLLNGLALLAQLRK